MYSLLVLSWVEHVPFTLMCGDNVQHMAPYVYMSGFNHRFFMKCCNPGVS